MKRNYKVYLLITAMMIPFTLFSQDWVNMMKDPTVNFYDVQKAFNKQNEKELREMEREQLRRTSGKRKKPERRGEKESEIPGYTQYKRWK